MKNTFNLKGLLVSIMVLCMIGFSVISISLLKGNSEEQLFESIEVKNIDNNSNIDVNNMKQNLRTALEEKNNSLIQKYIEELKKQGVDIHNDDYFKYKLAVYYYENANYERATKLFLEFYEDVNNIGGLTISYQYITNSLIMQEMYLEALTFIEKSVEQYAIEDSQMLQQMYYYNYYCYEKLGNYEEALKMMETLIKENPDDFKYWFLKYNLLKEFREDKSEEYLIDMKEKFPDKF